MTTVRELRDAILAIRKRNSPPLSTLNKTQLTALLAELEGKAPAKKIETAKPAAAPAPAKKMEAPKPEPKKERQLFYGGTYGWLTDKEAKAAGLDPNNRRKGTNIYGFHPTAAPALAKKMEAAKSATPTKDLTKTALNLPYVYKKSNPKSWLKLGKKLLLSAKKYAEKHPPKPRTKAQMRETFGLEPISFTDIPYIKKLGLTSASDIIYLGGEDGSYRTDVWNNDTMIEWEWEIKTEKNREVFYPEKVVGGRIGFRWLYHTDKYSEEHDEDFEDEEFENIIRLTLEIDNDNKMKWSTHARTNYEKGDDEEVDAVVEKALKKMESK